MANNVPNHGFTGEKAIYDIETLERRIAALESSTSATAEILNAIYPKGAIYLGLTTDDNPAVWGKKNGLNMTWTWEAFGGTSKFLLLTSPKDPGHVPVQQGYNGSDTVVVSDNTTNFRIKKGFTLSTDNLAPHTHSIPTTYTGNGTVKVAAPSQIKYNHDQSTAGATNGDGNIYLDMQATKGQTGNKAYFLWHPKVKTFSDPSLNLEDGTFHLVGGLPSGVKVSNPYQVAVSVSPKNGETRTGSLGAGKSVTLDITPPYYTVYMWRRTK